MLQNCDLVDLELLTSVTPLSDGGRRWKGADPAPLVPEED